MVLGNVYVEMGKLDEAIAEHRLVARVDPGFGGTLGHTYALAGQRDEARKILAKLPADEDRPFGAGLLAAGYAALGDKDEAFRWLDAGFEWREQALPWIRVYPPFKALRDDPRFHDLLRRMNLPQL